MDLQAITLPKDLTGSSAANRISSEYQQIEGGARGLIRPYYAPFYKDSLQVHSVSGQNVLSVLFYPQDYTFGDLDVEATKESGKEVYRSILLVNPYLTSIFSVSYQAFGGEKNVNTTALYTDAQLVSVRRQIDFSLLLDTPAVYPPINHTNDIADVYGFDVLINRFLSKMADALTKRAPNYKDQEIAIGANKVAQAVGENISALNSAIRAHLDTSGSFHPYTKAVVGLGNVDNYGFEEIVVDADTTLPRFGNPTDISYLLINRPEYVAHDHSELVNNPHGSTPASLGLGSVNNYTLKLNYVPGSYLTVFQTSQVPYYLSAFTVTNSVTDYAQARYQQDFTHLVQDFDNTKPGVMKDIHTLQVQAESVYLDSEALYATLEDRTSEAVSLCNLAVRANQKRKVVYNNAVYAHAVQHLMDFERSQYRLGAGTTLNGYLEVPKLFKGLYAWISANGEGNKYFTDVSGKVRVTQVVDKSLYAREFTASSTNTAPVYGPSQDVRDNASGITSGSVMKFSAGTHLNLTKGSAIRLKPGMTIVYLTRSGELETELSILNDPSSEVDARVLVNTRTNRSIRIDSGDAWIPMLAPSGSMSPLFSNIGICSISDKAEQFCWYGSTKAILRNSTQRGAATPVSPWPGKDYVGRPMTMIGNDNFVVPTQGEIAEILIYDYQLSSLEIKALVSYLQMRYSADAGLAVDYSALSAF